MPLSSAHTETAKITGIGMDKYYLNNNQYHQLVLSLKTACAFLLAFFLFSSVAVVPDQTRKEEGKT